MSEVAALGSSEFVLGFQLVGIRNTIERKPGDNAFAQLSPLLSNKDLDILIVDESTLNELEQEQKEKVEGSKKPVVVIVTKTAAAENLRKSIIQAIGVDLWRN